MDNLTQIKYDTNQGLENKQLMGLLNHDISKAFDSTWIHSKIIKLNQNTID